ncbi:hypothetical protein KQ940_10310 [Marinobacterium sp. D7]|uniref:hypothetical protein n=1 Tax=Marinobacterium ramblicola TaxID=2849041 RepID=UPI001C2DC054|nr:hypothetical protein [Marinobacterium ramblicola]MBV1788450.1 hypothetical protein [Marinobacterium ramblicola]
MFEAHYFSQEPSQELYHAPSQALSQPGFPLFSAAAEPALTRRLHSHIHQCPLHVWAAQGKRKNDQSIPQPRWFLYIEYCRRNGARDWVLIERSRAQPLDDLFAEVPWLELPGIDPKRTGDWLDRVC